VGSTIGRFLQANGVTATYLDLDPDNVALLRKLGLKVFYGDASRFDLLHAAGAEDARLLIVAVDESEKTLEIVKTAQKHFPHLKIISRTRSWNDSYELIEAGIKDIYRETLDSALRMAAGALTKLGHRKHTVQRAVRTFRKHDELYLHELAQMHHDKNELLNQTRLRIADLEKLMVNEMEDVGKDKDLGWDATTLIAEFGVKKST
jgi:voltage-gated potassium channel Kch